MSGESWIKSVGNPPGSHGLPTGYPPNNCAIPYEGQNAKISSYTNRFMFDPCGDCEQKDALDRNPIVAGDYLDIGEVLQYHTLEAVSWRLFSPCEGFKLRIEIVDTCTFDTVHEILPAWDAGIDLSDPAADTFNSDDHHGACWLPAGDKSAPVDPRYVQKCNQAIRIYFDEIPGEVYPDKCCPCCLKFHIGWVVRAHCVEDR